jgi:tetratricopeptide (TPR) repeat protein
MNTKATSIAVGAVILIVAASAYLITYYYDKPVDRADLESFVTAFDAGDIDAAIQEGEELVGRDATDVQALLALATSYAQKGSLSFDEQTYGQKAIDTALLVLELEPDQAEAYRIIGYANEIMERYDEAHNAYDTAIRLNPSNAQAYSNKGHAYELQGDRESAEEYYLQALALDPTEDHALVNLARIQLWGMRFDEARDTVGRLIESTQNARFLAEGYQILGIAEAAKSEPDTEAARAHFQKALSYDPNMAQVHISLANLVLATIYDAETDEQLAAMLADAQAHLDAAITINPEATIAYVLSRRVALIEGNATKAETMKARALAVVDGDITLGANEKEAIKSDLSGDATVVVTSSTLTEEIIEE